MMHMEYHTKSLWMTTQQQVSELMQVMADSFANDAEDLKLIQGIVGARANLGTALEIWREAEAALTMMSPEDRKEASRVAEETLGHITRALNGGG